MQQIVEQLHEVLRCVFCSSLLFFLLVSHRQQAEALAALQQLRAQMKQEFPTELEQQLESVLKEIPKYEAEVKRIHAQMGEVTKRSAKAREKAEKLAAKKEAAIQEEQRKLENERERLRARE